MEAVVKKKRKVRSDKKYTYRKKNGKMQPYISKRDDKSAPVKLWFWRRESMLPESIKRIPKKLRATASKYVFKFDIRVDVNPSELSTKKRVEENAVLSLGRAGDFNMMMFCKRKNKGHVSPCKVARIIITDTPKGLMGEMIENTRLHRYWFYKGSDK